MKMAVQAVVVVQVQARVQVEPVVHGVQMVVVVVEARHGAGGVPVWRRRQGRQGVRE